MSPQRISHHLYGIAVQQRVFDGYINAYQLCKAHYEKTGELKEPSHWLSNSATKSIIEKLAEAEGIPSDELTETKRGRNGGTWIHPRLAVRFAMWLNEDFSLQVEDWVQEWTTWNITPVQLAYSELRELAEIVEVAIQATQMIHTASHGLTAILNMAYKKLYSIRENQTNTFASNDLYYKQVARVQEKIYELENKVSNLCLTDPEDTTALTIDVEAENTIQLLDEKLCVLQESYEEIEIEAEFLKAQEEALSENITSQVCVALGSFGRESNKLEFQAIRRQEEITVYAFSGGKRIGNSYTFSTWDYPREDEMSPYFPKSYCRQNYCGKIHFEMLGQYNVYANTTSYAIHRAVKEVLNNNYYWLVRQARTIVDLENARKFLASNVNQIN